MPYEKDTSLNIDLSKSRARGWMALVTIFWNLVPLTFALLATAYPADWAKTSPFMLFILLSLTVLVGQAMPFARSTWFGIKAKEAHNIDEFEGAINYGVISKSYRATGLTMLFALLGLMLAVDVGDVEISTNAAIYWLLWFAHIPLAYPNIFAALAVRADISDEDDELTA